MTTDAPPLFSERTFDRIGAAGGIASALLFAAGWAFWRLPGLPVAIDGRANLHGDERMLRSARTWAGLQGWDADPELAQAGVVIADSRSALASRSPENTGEVLLTIMERRLDNIVHRLGWAPSRPAARQLVAHGHVTLNGRYCNVPSSLVRQGDTIAVKQHTRSLQIVRLALQESPPPLPDYLEMTGTEPPTAVVRRMPTRGDVDPRIAEVREQLIIELTNR